MCAEVGEKEMLAIFERIKDNKPAESSHEEAIIMLLSIVDGIEKAALEQNKASIKEYTGEEAIKLFQFQNANDFI
jgi:glutamine synthetase type III